MPPVITTRLGVVVPPGKKGSVSIAHCARNCMSTSLGKFRAIMRNCKSVVPFPESSARLECEFHRIVCFFSFALVSCEDPLDDVLHFVLNGERVITATGELECVCVSLWVLDREKS